MQPASGPNGSAPITEDSQLTLKFRLFLTKLIDEPIPLALNLVEQVLVLPELLRELRSDRVMLLRKAVRIFLSLLGLLEQIIEGFFALLDLSPKRANSVFKCFFARPFIGIS